MDMSGISLAENLRRIASVPLLYEPGTSWGYSLATDVLGALIERVYGEPLDIAVHQLVTGPLAMADTGFIARDAQRVATAYVNDEPQPHPLAEGEIVSPFDGVVGIRYSPQRIFNPQEFPSGGAGMAGTAEDFMRLLEALRQGQGAILPNELIAEMARDRTTNMALPNVPGFGFGLGFSVLRDPTLAASPESEGTWRWEAPMATHGSWIARRGLASSLSPTPCMKACRGASSPICAMRSAALRGLSDEFDDAEIHARRIAAGACDGGFHYHSDRSAAGWPVAPNGARPGRQ
jgi:CubicO group peptidase (beta-lactamase class C family)